MVVFFVIHLKNQNELSKNALIFQKFVYIDKCSKCSLHFHILNITNLSTFQATKNAIISFKYTFVVSLTCQINKDFEIITKFQVTKSVFSNVMFLGS